MTALFKFQLEVLEFGISPTKFYWVCVKMEAFNLLVQFVINDTSRVFKVDHIVWKRDCICINTLHLPFGSCHQSKFTETQTVSIKKGWFLHMTATLMDSVSLELVWWRQISIRFQTVIKLSHHESSCSKMVLFNMRGKKIKKTFIKLK